MTRSLWEVVFSTSQRKLQIYRTLLGDSGGCTFSMLMFRPVKLFKRKHVCVGDTIIIVHHANTLYISSSSFCCACLHVCLSVYVSVCVCEVGICALEWRNDYNNEQIFHSFVVSSSGVTLFSSKLLCLSLKRYYQHWCVIC
jgi:hypothetical protein